MLKSILKLIKNPFYGVPFFVLFFLITPFFLSKFIKIIDNFIIDYFLLMILLILLIESFFIIFYKIFKGIDYKVIKKLPFEKFYVEPHPYLPYIYKRNFSTAPSEKYSYPLSSNFFSAELKTNNFGFYNGSDGTRDIELPKPKNLFRINCIGGSTTANYIFDGKKNYSYPMELENILKTKNSNVEVNNCGTGGYNSADILIRFLLQTIETKPDLIIIYHAYNDIKSYLTKNFQSDYSHSRKNLGEEYQKFRANTQIPDIPLKFYNYLIQKWFPNNIRSSILEVISKGDFDLNSNCKEGLKVFKRNLQNLVYVCKKNNIDVILSSFCFYLHPSVKENNLHKKYYEIVSQENLIMQEIAKKNELKFVDCDKKIPKTKEYFLDTIHFTPKGMRFIAEEISKQITV